jgi:hypothetical protein
MLREFWFQILIALAGIVLGIAGTYTDDPTRRWWWTLGAALLFAAVLSYIWGDPVRGPFYSLLKPQARDTFRIHAGVTAGFPIRDLSNGVDFSRVINIDGKAPFGLRVTRTWWAGWEYEVSLPLGADVNVKITNDSMTGIPSGWDFNNDETAMELVGPSGDPVFQLIQSSDFDIYVNATLKQQDGRYIVLNGDKLLSTFDKAKVLENGLPVIFKYPRYIHHGVRR